MKRIGIEEVHQRVLRIAKEFDRICTNHNIPYYMIGGTMLGAIRHHGFIPWDDDMDFGVPIEYYRLLENVLSKELPYPYRCCTYKNHPGVLHNFIKIEDRLTCIDDKAIDLPIELKLGLNIDVFPLNKCSLAGKKEKRLRCRVDLLGMIYMRSVSHPDSKVRSLVKHVLRTINRGSLRDLQDEIEKRLFDIDEGGFLGNLLGRWREKEIVPLEWYGVGKRYAFEDTSFVGIAEYDKYLTRLYGDYMSLPPENRQVAHVENVYLR